MPDNFPGLDLGADDYKSEGNDDSFGLSKFLSKPSPKPYQPFGGPIQQDPQTFAQPQYYEQPQQTPAQQSFNVFSDDELDTYDKAKEDYKYINSYASSANQIASKRKSNYDDFMSNKLKPFFESVGGFGDFDDDEGFISALDEMEQNLLATSQQEDGWLGASDEKIRAGETLKGFQVWSSPNGLRDQYRRFRSERDHYTGIADTYKNDKIKRLEQLTNIPLPAKQVLDEELKARGNTPQGRLSKAAKSGRKSTGKNKDLNAYLDSFDFEEPMYSGFGLSNLDKTDPRTSVPIDNLSGTNQKRQSERLSAAMRGDTQGILSRREHIAKERRLRDKGILFSQSGLLDGRPIGMSRSDVDLLDIGEMKKMGIEEYRGVPIEQAFLALGGDERLQVAKILEATRGAYLNYENAQIKWLAGNQDPALKKKMDEAQAVFTKSLGLASEFGLTDELVEQNEKKGFFARMGDSVDRGLKLNEMSKYASDFFLNAADQSDIEKFIQAATEFGEIPVGSASQKFQSYQSKGLWDSISNLLFENTSAIPELFTESMASFLPAYLRTGAKTITTAAAVGALTPIPGGALGSAGVAARLNWGVASLVLEYSGMVLEGMQKLGIDWQNPKVFTAAWNNESVREKIKDRALKKGVPIALFDAMSGMLGGRISGAMNHVGGSIKGGKLLDAAAWKRSQATAPRFTKFQRAGNAAADIAADATLGMAGEFVGQAWSKEPGEAWDTNAIAAEGIIGLGPGLAGAAYQVSPTTKIDVSNTPFDYEEVKNTESGQTGVVNLAGFRNQFSSYKNAQGAAAHVINEGNYANAEDKKNATAVLTDLMSRFYALNPEVMSKLKLVVADRTPFADKEMEGSFHKDNESGTYAIYLNRNKIGQDPLGVFLHEAGHLARELMISQDQLMEIYEAVGVDAQKDAFSQYTLKVPDAKYSQLDESQKAQVDRAWNAKRMTPMVRAEEWFSYQWASLLAGRNVDSAVKTEYQNFLTKVIHPSIERFTGGESTGGSKEQQFDLNQLILGKMGFTPNGFSKDTGPSFGQYYHERPGMAQEFFAKETPIQQMGDEEALNSLMRKIAVIKGVQGEAQAKKIAEGVNKILGKKLLPTEMSAYTDTELGNVQENIVANRVSLGDDVATGDIYKKLKGKDAERGVEQLLNKESETKTENVVDILDKDKRVESAKENLKEVESELSSVEKQFKTSKDRVERKRVGKKVIESRKKAKSSREQLASAKKEAARVQNLPKEKPVKDDSPEGVAREITNRAKRGEAVVSQEDRVISSINEVQNLLPSANIKESNGKFSLTTRLPGTRRSGPAQQFDTREAAEKAQKEFYAAEREKLKTVSEKVTAMSKLVLDQKAFEKRAEEAKKKLLDETNGQEGDISYGQIIAEIMDLNALQDSAIFSSALAGLGLADVSSLKAASAEIVRQAFVEYEQRVEFATGAISTRIAQLEKSKEAILNPKALGSAQAKEYKYSHKIVVVVNRFGDKVEYREWDGSKFGPKKSAERSAKGAKSKKEGDYIQRYNDKYHKYLAKEYKAAKAVAENEKGLNPKFIQYKQNLNQGAPKQATKAKAPAKTTPKAKQAEPKAKPEATKEEPKKPELTKEQKAELADINKKLKMLKQYLHAIEPEKTTIDWKDVPHFNYYKYVGAGNRPTKENGGFKTENFEKYTLGQLANSGRDTAIWHKDKGVWKEVGGVSDSQSYLFKYTNWRLWEGSKTQPKTKAKKKTETKAPEPETAQIDEIQDKDGNVLSADPTALGSGIDQSQAFNPFVNGRKLTDKLSWFGGKTVQEYVDMLDAVRASVAMPEGVGTNRYTDKDRLFFQSEKGTPVASMMLFRLREMDKKAGINYRDLVNGDIDRVMLSEMTVYELATGRGLEILDDRDFRGSKQQRYHQIIELRASEMAKDIAEYEQLLEKTDDPKERARIDRILNGYDDEVEISGPKNSNKSVPANKPGKDVKGSRIPGLRQKLTALYFDYDEAGAFQGEETGGYFAKIHGGKQWTETLTEFLFYKEKLDAIDKITGIWESDIAEDMGVANRRKPDESKSEPGWSGGLSAWNKLTADERRVFIAKELRKTPGAEDAYKQAKKKFEELRDKAKAEFEESISEKTAEESTQSVKAWGADIVSPDEYEFFSLAELDTQTVKSGKGHGAFARGSADQGIAVLDLFAASRADDFSPNRTTFGTGSGSEQISPDIARSLENKRALALDRAIAEEFNSEKYQDIPVYEITKPDGKKLKVKRVKGLWKKGNGHSLPENLETRARDQFLIDNPEIENRARQKAALIDAQATSGISSGNSVSPVQFVEYLLSQIKTRKFNPKSDNALKKAVLSLQYEPSSEVSGDSYKQLPGGPGGGIVPYVWADFIKEAYKLLNIKEDPTFVASKDPKKSGWKNLSEEVRRTVTEKGKSTQISEPNTLWSNGVPDIDTAVKQVKPIIQAVYDAGRVRLADGRGFDETETSKNSSNATNVLQRNPISNSVEDFIKDDAPEGVLDNMETDDGGFKATQKSEDESGESVDSNQIKKIEDINLNDPVSFRGPDFTIDPLNDKISQALSGTETNKKLFNLKKDGKALSLEKIMREFRTDEVFWNAFDMPMPPAQKYLIYKWAKDLKQHPNYPKLKVRVMDPGTSSLSSGISDDSIGATRILTSLANKVGLGESGRQDLKNYFVKHKESFSKDGVIAAALDSARPSTGIISNALKDIGIEDKGLLDALDVKGLWQQYFGKTDEVVRQAHLRFIEPIEDALADHGITNEQWGKYLIARAAPSRNDHIKKLYLEYLKDAKDDHKEAIQQMIDENADRMSGVSTELAIEVVQTMEKDKNFLAFLKDERNPLQKFYDFNREGLRHRSANGLMKNDQDGGINEELAMVTASSSFNWKKQGGSAFMYQFNGADNEYSYAPMQGFEGETQTLFDNERAYEIGGKSSTAAGRAWDMPKHKFLFKGSFGRLGENAVAPDPEMVFPVAQSQYYEGAILGQKNTVSNAFGLAFEILRTVAYNGKEVVGDSLPLLDLNSIPGGKEILNKIEKDPTIIEAARELFEGKDAVFKKEFRRVDVKKHYEIKTEKLVVGDQKIDGLVMARREINKEFQNNPLVFTYRKNGEPFYIEMQNNERGMRFASSVKNLRYETLPKFLSGVNAVTRFMASMFTSKNPAFLIPNFFRDLQTAYIHLTEDDKKEFAKNVFSYSRLKGFMGGILNVEQRKARGASTLLDDFPTDRKEANEYAKKILANKDYEKMYQFAVQAGAKVGYFRNKPVTEMIEDLQKMQEKGKKNKKSERNMLRHAVDTFDSINTAVENTVRMSAFWSAIENGRTVHEAANISRNVTVDFNQKGTMTQTFGAFFVFFGASMNSMDRMVQTFNKRGLEGSAKLITGIVLASMLVNLFNRLIDDDEEEDEPGYDRISSYRRDTTALISMPGKENTGYVGIPLALGYNMFWTMGQTAMDVFAKYAMGRGGSGPMDFMSRNMAATLNSFNPIGGAGLGTAFMPTPVKPFFEVWANKNFMDAPIRMEDRPFEAPKPAHMMDPKRTQEHWTALSKSINEFMGGSDQVKGSASGIFGADPLKSLEDSDMKWDISGSQLEHILLGYTGGPGQLLNAAFGGLLWPGLPGTSEDYGQFDANKMPISNRFYRSSTSNASTKNTYYQIRTANKTAERAVKAAKVAGPKELAYTQQEMKDLLTLSSSVKYADALKSKIRAQKSKIESSKALTQDQKLQRIADLEKKEHAAYVSVIKKAQALGIS